MRPNIIETMWQNIYPGDIIATNHGKGDLIVQNVTQGKTGVVTITGHHVGGEPGKKRVPNSGIVDLIQRNPFPNNHAPVAPPAPVDPVKPRGKSRAAAAIGRS